MIPRIRWVGLAMLALLTVASACLAAEDEPAYKPGRGGVGGQFGGSTFAVDRIFGGADWFADYSHAAMPRFAFAGTFRYVSSNRWRWQISPGFTWTAYRTGTVSPFVDRNFPDDRVKDDMIALVAPVTVQAQFVVRRGHWFYHAGAGPGLYRVWIENNRKVLSDPQTFRLHRGLYPGAAFELGAERFLRAITTTSVEAAWVTHLAFTQRDQQFPSGYNSNLAFSELRIGVNYYFDPARKKQPKSVIDVPETK